MCLACACPVFAQADADPGAPTADGTSSEYRQLVQKALQEYELGHWSEAKSFFNEAHALHPNARTLRGLGLASYELRSYVEAIGYFRSALQSRERPLTAAMRDQLEELLEQSEAFIAHYDLKLDPPNATLRVDGSAAVRAGDGSLMLDPGSHEIVVRSAGFETATRHVVARGRHREVLAVELVREGSPGAMSADDGGFFATRTPRQWAGLSLGLAGLVGVGVGTAFGVIAMGDKSDSEADCVGDRCNADGIEARADAHRAGNVATVGFVVGGALLAGGFVLYLTGAPAEAAPEAASLRLSPSAGPGQFGLALAGRLP